MLLHNHTGWFGFSVHICDDAHICDKMQFLILRISFYKPNHEDPNGVNWFEKNGRFLYWLEKHKQKKKYLLE